MENKIYYYHGKLNDGTRYTVAGAIGQIHDNLDNEDLNLGFSICSKNDQFVRKLGRVRAAGRMLSKSNKGRNMISLYDSDLPSKSKLGHKENYWVGQEASVFVRIVQDKVNNIIDQKSLQAEFSL